MVLILSNVVLYFLEPYFNSMKALETILNIIKKDLG